MKLFLVKKKKFTINGDNYRTRDGTPERDFIHVSDLAELHYLVAKYLLKNKSEFSTVVMGKVILF